MEMCPNSDTSTSSSKRPEEVVAACGVVARHFTWTTTGVFHMTHRLVKHLCKLSLFECSMQFVSVVYR
jgi:hypothetical protein